LVRGVRDRVLVRPQDAVEAMPENPRDAEGRILCPICKRPIGSEEPTSEGGAFVYHRDCWRPRGGSGRTESARRASLSYGRSRWFS
jgi:hypothetical protein